jgi:hypothetical protein
MSQLKYFFGFFNFTRVKLHRNYTLKIHRLNSDHMDQSENYKMNKNPINVYKNKCKYIMIDDNISLVESFKKFHSVIANLMVPTQK